MGRSFRTVSRVAFALLLVCSVLAIVPRSALAYSCPPTGVHCYALNSWNGDTRGVAGDISIAYIYTNDGSNTSINNTIWLVDTTSNYWVEAGYRSNLGITNYYWGDVRPSDPMYRRHLMTQIPGQHYGSGLDINISRENDNTSFVAAFHVNAVGYSSYNYSTNNTMIPGHIDIGQELSGTTGSHADPAAFTYNQWQTSDGYYHMQTDNGYTTYVGGPPQGYFSEYPSASAIGGIWHSLCGC